MAVNLSPVFNDAQLDSSGNPFSNALLFTYEAGSSTKLTTYKDSAAGTAHDNPIVLNSRGEPSSPIWLTSGQTYKFRLCLSTESDPPSTSIRDIDNVSGVNDTTVTVDQWAASGLTPTYVSATQFTLAGDQTTAFHVGRRLKITDAGGTKYGYITVSAYTTLTTVTVVLDSGNLETPTSAVSYGIQTSDNPSEPLLTDAFPVRSGSSDKTKKVRLEVDGLTTATTRVVTVPDADLTLPTGVPPMVIGCDCKNNSGTPDTQFDLDADVILLRDTNNGGVIKFAPGAAITNNISTAGPAANGRDQAGAFSNDTWLHFYWIWNGATLASVSSTVAPTTGPTLPSGYTHWAYAGPVRHGTGAMVKTRFRGAEAFYDTRQSVLSSGTGTTETTVSVATAVPPNAHSYNLHVSCNDQTDGAGLLDITVNLRVVTTLDYAIMRWSLSGLGTTTSTFYDFGNTRLPNVSQSFFYIRTITNGVGSNGLAGYVTGYRIPNGGE